MTSEMVFCGLSLNLDKGRQIFWFVYFGSILDCSSTKHFIYSMSECLWLSLSLFVIIPNELLNFVWKH